MDVLYWGDLLAWIGGVTGVLLLLMMLSSILLGGDFDFDLDSDVDGQSMGILKSILTFTSISTLTLRALLMHSEFSLLVNLIIGVVAGIFAVFALYALFRLLLGQQEDGSWKLYEAVGQLGRVYIPIPEKGEGKVIVNINKVDREISARSKNNILISTDSVVLVVDNDEKSLVVVPYDENTQ